MSVISPTDLPRLNGEIDNTIERPGQRAPLITANNDFTTVTEKVAGIPQRRPPLGWYFAFACSLGLLSLLGITIGSLVPTGVGVWGHNNTVNWAFDIVNFVFWVGI